MGWLFWWMFSVGDNVACEFFLISSCQKNTTFPPPHAGVRENVLHSRASFCTSHTSRFQGCANTGQNVSCRHVGVQETQMFAFFFPQPITIQHSATRRERNILFLLAAWSLVCLGFKRDVSPNVKNLWTRFYLLVFMKVRLFQMTLHAMCFNSWSQRYSRLTSVAGNMKWIRVVICRQQLQLYVYSVRSYW